MTTGPNVYSSITADEMDVGFLGNGMAWHYFEQDSKMSLLTIDNLTDDDKLLMRKELGYAGDGKESLDTFYERLPGTTIALDLTTTPGVFWKSLVSAINEGREEPIWYEDVEGAYPEKEAMRKSEHPEYCECEYYGGHGGSEHRWLYLLRKCKERASGEWELYNGFFHKVAFGRYNYAKPVLRKYSVG